MVNVKEIKTRLLWLGLGLAASLMIAHVITSFEEVLHENIILASFIPLIVYMSDAVGTQMEAMIIRELNRKAKFRFQQFFCRQLLVVFPVAVIISAVSTGVLYLWHNDIRLSTVVGLSLFLGIMSSLVTGALMPYFFWRLHEDPAEASGPMATVLQDFLSVVIFFYIAQFLL